MTARFTGWHMLALMVAFFGVVIAVNLFMARVAIGTFGGTVVDNSYVASQKFNTWLEQAREQDKLGWKVAMTLDGARRAEVRVAVQGEPLTGIAATAVAEHPLGRAPDVALAFVDTGDGVLRATTPLPDGRWLVRLTLTRDGKTVRRAQILQ